jgi:hypothetical protein
MVENSRERRIDEEEAGMSSWRGQRGELSIGCIVGVVFLLLVTVIAINIVPTLLRVYEMQTTVENLADRANRRDYKDARIERLLLEKAEELHLPVGPQDIKVKRTRSFIDISVTYDIQLKVLFWTYDLHKVHAETRPLF